MRLEAEVTVSTSSIRVGVLTKLARLDRHVEGREGIGDVPALGYDGASDKVWISLWPAEGVSWPPEPMMNWQLGSEWRGDCSTCRSKLSHEIIEMAHSVGEPRPRAPPCGRVGGGCPARP